MKKNKQATANPIILSLLWAALFIMVGLKLTGVISISWLAVFAPMLIYLAVCVVLGGIYGAYNYLNK